MQEGIMQHETLTWTRNLFLPWSLAHLFKFNEKRTNQIFRSLLVEISIKCLHAMLYPPKLFWLLHTGTASLLPIFRNLWISVLWFYILFISWFCKLLILSSSCSSLVIISWHVLNSFSKWWATLYNNLSS